MTEIKIKKTPLGRRVTLKGHATHSKGDGAVVCTAVSTVTRTLAEYITKAEDEGTADIIDITLKSGNAVIDYIADDDEVNIGVDAILCGFYMLAESFEDYVTCEELTA